MSKGVLVRISKVLRRTENSSDNIGLNDKFIIYNCSYNIGFHDKFTINKSNCFSCSTEKLYIFELWSFFFTQYLYRNCHKLYNDVTKVKKKSYRLQKEKDSLLYVTKCKQPLKI